MEKIENNIAYFKTDLTYTDYVKIDEVLKKKIPLMGYEYYSICGGVGVKNFPVKKICIRCETATQTGGLWVCGSRSDLVYFSF